MKNLIHKAVMFVYIAHCTYGHNMHTSLHIMKTLKICLLIRYDLYIYLVNIFVYVCPSS